MNWRTLKLLIKIDKENYVISIGSETIRSEYYSTFVGNKMSSICDVRPLKFGKFISSKKLNALNSIRFWKCQEIIERTGVLVSCIDVKVIYVPTISLWSPQAPNAWHTNQKTIEYLCASSTHSGFIPSGGRTWIVGGGQWFFGMYAFDDLAKSSFRRMHFALFMLIKFRCKNKCKHMH